MINLDLGEKEYWVIHNPIIKMHDVNKYCVIWQQSSKYAN